MNALDYGTLQKELSHTLEQVCFDREPVIITRKDREAVVLISLEDYRSLAETAYLSRSPKNAKRVFESIEELEAGYGTERELIDA